MEIQPPEMPLPPDQLKDMLIRGILAELRINLYHDLKKILGDKQGREVFKDLYRRSSVRAVDNYLGPNPSVEMIVKLELVNFKLFGFELTANVEEENGEKVYYEHFTKCPFLDYTRMKGYDEIPCDTLCKFDSERGMDHEVGRWECLSRMADGADECVFRIREYKKFEDKDEIKNLMFNRTRLNSKYTEKYRDDY